LSVHPSSIPANPSIPNRTKDDDEEENWDTSTGSEGLRHANWLRLGLTGFTTAPDFPTAAHSIPAPPVGLQTFEGFVSKLSFDSVSSTLSLVYSTYLGGSGLDEARAIAVDSFGNAYVAGYNISPDFPTVHSLPASLAGGTAFISKLSFDSLTSTLSLVYSTFLGGSSGIDEAYGIALDAGDNAYVSSWRSPMPREFPVCRRP